jgi:superfamily II helicase
MVRDLRINIRVNELEDDELQKRADKAHLRKASYCRWYLFNTQFFTSAAAPIERISRGIPKRIASQQTTDAVKSTIHRQEVMEEMKRVFRKGLVLKKVTEEMKSEVLRNRKKEEFQPKIDIMKLNPPK